MTRRFCLLLMSGAAGAQVTRPRIGYVVDRENCLRSVEGVAGAFTLGHVIEADVVSAAYSGKTLVVKKAAHVLVNDRTFDAPDGPMTVVFDGRGDAAEIFFSAARVLWTLQDGNYSSHPAYDVVADVYVRRWELVVNGVPVRIGFDVRTVSQLGEGWLVVYGDAGMYAVRGAQVYELPEGDSE